MKILNEFLLRAKTWIFVLVLSFSFFWLLSQGLLEKEEIEHLTQYLYMAVVFFPLWAVALGYKRSKK
jgi:O-antigen/teichoic acid export membrane protein